MKRLDQLFQSNSTKTYSLDNVDRKIIESKLLESFKEVVQQETNRRNVFYVAKLFSKNQSDAKKSIRNKIIFRTLLRLRSHLDKPLLLLRKACKVILKKLISIIRKLNKTSSTGRLITFIKSLQYNRVKLQYSYS